MQRISGLCYQGADKKAKGAQGTKSTSLLLNLTSPQIRHYPQLLKMPRMYLEKGFISWGRRLTPEPEGQPLSLLDLEAVNERLENMR